jgi:enolase
MRILLECYHALEKILKENKLSTNVGNEGAFAPNGISSNEAPFVYMLQAIERAGYTPGSDIGFSIDAAASEFFREGKYVLQIENRALSSAEVIEYFRSWLNKYPIVTLEDPLHEDDWNNWSEAKRMCDEHKVLLVGDDLTVTSAERLQKAIDSQAISSILIKLNQIGSLSETVATCMLAQTHGMSVIPSHRGGGETNDTAMIDLAVAVGGKFIKVGPTRGERVAKYNRLLEIERELRG